MRARCYTGGFVQSSDTRRLVIAIDGPSGVGKGTVSRALAAALGYRHIDTGAMYRAVGWAAQQRRLSLHEEAPVAQLAEQVPMSLEGGDVLVDGTDVTRAIRTPEMDAAAAQVARMPRVRAALVARQRAMGEGGGVVMEGRDIGTVVFPDADVKLYLDASADERARRRAADPAHGGSAQLSEVASALAARDKSDSTRTASPLTMADDAVRLDTTGVPVHEVVERALEVVRAVQRGADKR
jgi:cytidylate kinase